MLHGFRAATLPYLVLGACLNICTLSSLLGVASYAFKYLDESDPLVMAFKCESFFTLQAVSLAHCHFKSTSPLIVLMKKTRLERSHLY